jgi:hypothetical protein
MSVSDVGAPSSATSAISEKSADAAGPQNSSSSEPTSTAERTGSAGTSAEASSSSGSSSSASNPNNSTNPDNLIPLLDPTRRAGAGGTDGSYHASVSMVEDQHYICSLMSGDQILVSKKEVLEANAVHFEGIAEKKRVANQKAVQKTDAAKERLRLLELAVMQERKVVEAAEKKQIDAKQAFDKADANARAATEAAALLRGKCAGETADAPAPQIQKKDGQENKSRRTSESGKIAGKRKRSDEDGDGEFDDKSDEDATSIQPSKKEAKWDEQSDTNGDVRGGLLGVDDDGDAVFNSPHDDTLKHGNDKLSSIIQADSNTETSLLISASILRSATRKALNQHRQKEGERAVPIDELVFLVFEN